MENPERKGNISRRRFLKLALLGGAAMTVYGISRLNSEYGNRELLKKMS